MAWFDKEIIAGGGTDLVCLQVKDEGLEPWALRTDWEEGISPQSAKATNVRASGIYTVRNAVSMIDCGEWISNGQIQNLRKC